MRPVLLFSLALAGTAWAQNATTPGAVTAPHPTLESASLEWAFSGDTNADGVVTVRYRKVGSAAFDVALPLRRVAAGANQGFTWSSKHSGSLFGLEAATQYEVELTLVDPDGGGTTRTVMLTTRGEPKAATGAATKAVTPGSFAAQAATAVAGDVLLLGDGAYPGFTFARDGTAGQPIVLRAQNAGGAVVNGDVRLDGRSYVLLEGLAVNGMIKLNGATGIAVKGCTVRTPGSGIVAQGTGSTDGYFCDNVVQGPTMTFDNTTVGANGNNLGEGIEVTGPGNVVCHNRVSGFRDCLSTLEDAEAVNQVSIDFVENDLSLCADDAIEADFAMGNVRVLRNRIGDSFVGISSQPSLGGPTWFVRNEMFNVIYSPFKLHRGSIGDVALHNTAVKCGDALGIYAGATWSQALFRNNLFIGGLGGGTYGGFGNGTGRVASLADADGTCSFDYDGYGSVGTGMFVGRIGATSFNSLAQLRSTTSEVHAEQVDLSVFAAAVTFPQSPFPPKGSVPSLLLAASGGAVDKGVALANVNDGFAGTAPDLGAHELGAAVPQYGPRTGMGGGAGGGSAGGGSAGGGSAGGGSAGGGSAGGGSAGGGSAGGGSAGGGSAGGGSAGGGEMTAGGCTCSSAPLATFALALAVLTRRSRRRR